MPGFHPLFPKFSKVFQNFRKFYTLFCPYNPHILPILTPELPFKPKNSIALQSFPDFARYY